VALSVAVLLLAGLGLLSLSGRWSSRDSLVVYCAHDSLYSDQILSEFERQTGISVRRRFDTEATKSLGLVNLLIHEKQHPRCDVFWNNQVLGTVSLKREGILLPYKGPGSARIPVEYKDPDGYWTGFSGRLRVYIFNTDKLLASEETVRQLLSGDLSNAAIAKPLYGTTLSHYCVLWDLWGGEKLKAWHREIRKRGVREVTGNATVKNLVAEGACDFGWTDTDDFFVAKDDGKPVAMLPVRLDDGATICIPNSVAIIKGTKRLSAAQKLVDFLLSEETELALAASKSRQIPLGPVHESKLSDEVRQLKAWSEDGYKLTALGSASVECLRWLKSEYLR
jgi:iron(III) transport system substrate-binding protein